MPTVVLKLFALQGTVRTDRQSGNYMLPLLGSITIIHKTQLVTSENQGLKIKWTTYQILLI